MRYRLVVGFFIALFIGSSAANATVDVSIDLSSQRMNVTSSSGSYSWPVSTARAGYVTPRGVFHSQALYRMTYSKPYNNAPMPHAIFFTGGYAIHGTYATGALGSPASHGCVRLAPGNAAILFQLVKAEGARITISGAPPLSRVASNSSHGKSTRVARGHGTKHARGTHTKSRHIAAQPPSQPAPQDMFGLFGGSF